MIILLFGPPGCGKGTQAALLVERLRIPAISTGEMFRAECKAGTILGRRARAILARGGLIGDDIVNAMVAGRIDQEDCRGGFLLDGYPRTVAQARFFMQLLDRRALADPLVIHLDVPAESLIERLGARRQCPRCLRIYNLITNPPKFETTCDDDGMALLRREDDSEQTIRDRIDAYHEQTGPVLKYFGETVVRRVDGSLPPDEVAKQVAEILAQTVVKAAV